MLGNYFKIAFRNFLKRKSYSFINLFGLSIGIASCIIILMYVKDELSYDTLHENADQIVRIQRAQVSNSGEINSTAAVNFSLADLVKENISQVEHITRIAPREFRVKVNEITFIESNFYLADSSLFDVFSLKMITGDESSLAKPMSVLLTPETAQKYFGTSSAVGQTLEINGEYTFTVTGIIEEMPSNSHFHFDFIASMESAKSMYSETTFNHWGNIWLYTYALLQPGSNADEVQSLLDDVINEFGPPALSQFGISFYLQPLKDIHFYSNTTSEIEPSGNATFVYVFLVIAILVLAIACFNFINLATARSSWRAKEVGVRKVMGAARTSLVKQFLSESLLITFLALIVAIIVIEASLPFLNSFLGKSLALNLATNFSLILGLFGILIIVGVLAGGYPSLVLSSFQPVKVLKGQSSSMEGKMGTLLRKVLVVFQFVISTTLIIGTLVVYAQLEFIKNTDIGLDKEQVLVLNLNNPESRDQINIFKQSLESNPDIYGVSAASDRLPGSLNSWRVRPIGSAEESEELIKIIAVDADFFSVLDIPVVSGRDFSEDRLSDLNSGVILNQSAADHFGFENPVGEGLFFSTTNRNSEVIGVTDDFHTSSLYEDVLPIAFHYYPSWYDQLYIKIGSENISQTLSSIENEWKEKYSAWPFEYSFLDDSFEALYEADRKLGLLIAVFSLLAIAVASLGLIGLASFTTELRFKEIGIRKVLGASVSNILQLLSKDYIALILISFVLSIPAAYFIMGKWLSNFTYKININVWVFLGAGAIIFLIALSAVSFQSIKAATMNPIDSLKNE